MLGGGARAAATCGTQRALHAFPHAHLCLYIAVGAGGKAARCLVPAMGSRSERIQRALDSLLYLPHLKAQHEDVSLSAFSTAPGGSERARGRVWDRGDLFYRLASFKVATWFCKPEAISPVECARRGWINTAPDLLTCEVRGERRWGRRRAQPS